MDYVGQFTKNCGAVAKGDDTRPYVAISYRGETMFALIDTGAMVSLVNNQMFSWLINNGARHTREDVVIQMADGTKIRTDRSVRFYGEICGEKHEFKMILVSHLTSSLIIGMDIIDDIGILEIKGKRYLKTRNGFSERGRDVPYVNAIEQLTNSEREELNRRLEEQMALFEEIPGVTQLVEHVIKLRSNDPIKQRFYPRNPAMQEIINKEVDSMLANGIIEPSKSPWSSPIVLVKKSSGQYRFCIDFRKVNQVTEKDAYPLPQINSILEKLKEAKYITTLDLKDGYWQVPLEVDSRPITAFTVPGKGLYQFTRMPFGLHSAGATFQRLLDRIIGPELEPKAFAYLDDLIIVSSSFQEHLVILTEVFERLRKAGLRVNATKCKFCQTQLKYLGHIVSDQGIATDPEKVNAVMNFPTPKSVRSLRSWLGLASWYRRFIPHFATITAPLTKLLKKTVRWNWSQEQEEAMNELKQALTSAPVLSCPDFKLTFVLQVDASIIGLGATLSQTQEERETVIAYASRLLTDGEKKFTVTELECLALVWAVRKFRPYIEGYKFIAITDHQALQWLMKIQQPTGRLARWILELQQYDFTIQYRRGKLNKVADALSRNPPEDLGLSEDEQHVEAIGTLSACNEETSSKKTLDGKAYESWYDSMVNKVTKNPNRYPRYLIRQGKLLKYIPARNESKQPDRSLDWKTCIGDRAKKSVLEETHDQATAGHMGFRKTAKRIAERYYWPGWRRDVRQYVRSCDNCQKYKVEQCKPAGLMRFRRPKGPWYSITADLIGPLPRSKKGNTYILVIQDCFSKWVEFAPLRAATAYQVSLKFQDIWLLRYGSPEVLIVDNGSQFTSKIFRNLAAEWKIEIQFTAPYSPQSNPVERYNRVLGLMIAQFVKNDHRSWDSNLSEFRFAMNTAVHDSTQYTPAMINYGRELRVPKSLCHPNILVDKPDRESRGATLRNIHDWCRKNLKKAFVAQAKFYNLRRRDVRYKVGDKVLKRSHVLSSAANAFASKLAPKYTGPFVVEAKKGYNIYQIRQEGSQKSVIAHVKDLKPYHISTSL